LLGRYSSLADYSHGVFEGTSYEIPEYETFSSLLPFHTSAVKIFPSAPCSQIPSVYVLLMPEIEFHTLTKLQVKL
jgi:hypothetical protein